MKLGLMNISIEGKLVEHFVDSQTSNRSFG